MATRSPYVVRLVGPDDQVAVKAREDPKFTRTWRGGFKDAEIVLKEPLDSHNPLLAPYSKLRIEDPHTGRILSETYVDLPGKSRSRTEGDVWRVGGVGPSARLSDRQRAWIGIDTSFEGWKLRVKTKGNMTGDLAADPNNEDIDAIVITWPDGMAIAAGDPNTGPRTTMRYDLLQQTGQFVGGMSFTHREGRADSNVKTELDVSTAGVVGSFEVARSRVWDTALDTIAASAGVNFDAGQAGKNFAVLRVIRVGGVATNVAADTWWSAVRNIRVSALRRDQSGDWIYGSVNDNDYLLAHEIVIDALFWFCARFTGPSTYISPIDIAGAQIDTSFTHQIDQLTYNDPTTLQQILEDLALLEVDMGWETLESNSNGQHRFLVHRVSDGTTKPGSSESGPRYLVAPRAYTDWNEPGGEADMRNAATIDWRGRNGKKLSESYLASDFDLEVDDLDKWLIVRDADPVHLSDELGSAGNADRIAEQLLRQAASPPVSGTLTATGKVHDAWSGMDVHPWEIETGYPLLIQDVDLDPLPITEVSVDGTVAQLTLSEPVLTDEQLINMNARRRRRRG